MPDLMSLIGVLGLLEMRIVPEQDLAGEYADNQEAMEKLQSLVPLASDNTTESYDKKAQLATLYLQTGSFDQAVPLLRDTLDGRRRLLGSDHPAIIHTEELLACALYAQGETVDALKEFQAACAIRTRTPGTEDGWTVQNMFNTGIVTWHIGEHQEACDIMSKTYKMSERVHGPHHPSTLSAMENSSFMYHFVERSWEAQKVQQKVVNVRLHDLPHDDGAILKSAILLGKICMDKEWWEDCEKTYSLIVELRTNLQGTDSPETLASKANLATAVQKKGRLDEAERICLEISDVARTEFGPESPVALRCKLRLATILSDKGEHIKALAIQREVLQIQEQVLGSSHEDTCCTLSNLSETLVELEQYDEAVTASKRLVSALEQRLGVCDPESLSARLDLSMLLARIDLIDEAEDIIANVISRCEGAEDSELLFKLRKAVNVLLQHGRTAPFNKFYLGL